MVDAALQAICQTLVQTRGLVFHAENLRPGDLIAGETFFDVVGRVNDGSRDYIADNLDDEKCYYRLSWQEDGETAAVVMEVEFESARYDVSPHDIFLGSSAPAAPGGQRHLDLNVDIIFSNETLGDVLAGNLPAFTTTFVGDDGSPLTETSITIRDGDPADGVFHTPTPFVTATTANARTAEYAEVRPEGLTSFSSDFIPFAWNNASTVLPRPTPPLEMVFVASGDARYDPVCRSLLADIDTNTARPYLYFTYANGPAAGSVEGHSTFDINVFFTRGWGSTNADRTDGIFQPGNTRNPGDEGIVLTQCDFMFTAAEDGQGVSLNLTLSIENFVNPSSAGGTQGTQGADYKRADARFAEPVAMEVGSAEQQKVEVLAYSAGNVWYNILASTSGCAIEPDVWSRASFAGVDSFVITQKPGSVGTDSCKDLGAWGNSTGLGGITLEAYAGNPGDYSQLLASVELLDEELRFEPAAMALELAAVNATAIDIYDFIAARLWQLADDGTLVSYAGSKHSLTNRRVAFGLPQSGADWTNYFYNNLIPLSDAFFVTLADLSAGNTLPVDLVAAGYDRAYFSYLEQFGIDAYLKLTDYGLTRDASLVNNLATAASTDNAGHLLRLTSSGLAQVSTEVLLQATICQLANHTAVTDSWADLVSFTCGDWAAQPTLGLAAEDAVKIISLDSYWQASESATDCAGLSSYVAERDFCGGAEVTGGQLSVSLPAEERDTTNPIPLHFAHYPAVLSGHANLRSPSLYLVEVYSFNQENQSEILARPVRILFEVEVK